MTSTVFVIYMAGDVTRPEPGGFFVLYSTNKLKQTQIISLFFVVLNFTLRKKEERH